MEAMGSPYSLTSVLTASRISPHGLFGRSMVGLLYKESGKKRQLFMVTHNPNLAVVCDAEQMIYCSFDRKKSSKITYVSGAIENPVINVHVVNVLEGTKRAFDNRRSKYH